MSQGDQHVKIFGNGCRSARGAFGVTTFTPTLGFIGILLSTAIALEAGDIAVSAVTADMSKALFGRGNEENVIFVVSSTREVDIESGDFAPKQATIFGWQICHQSHWHQFSNP